MVNTPFFSVYSITSPSTGQEKVSAFNCYIEI